DPLVTGVQTCALPISVSALTGPFTREQILRSWSSKVFPSFEISVGLVVIPSRMPVLAASRISSRLAVSRKNFIVFSYFHCSKLTGAAALWSPKWDAHWAFVSDLVDRRNGVIHTGPVRRVNK